MHLTGAQLAASLSCSSLVLWCFRKATELIRCRASFSGTRIILRQVSPESEPIYDLIIALYEGCSGDWKELQKQAGISDDDLKHFLEYAVQFLGNNGNYKGFGDSKFVPRLSTSAFEALVSTTRQAKAIFDGLGGKDGAIFADTKNPKIMHLGFPDQGHLSTYYPDSPDITQEEIEAIGEFIAEKEILPENTRLKKLKSGGFELLVASSIESPPANDIDSINGETTFDLDGRLKGKTLKVVFGDYKEEMAKVALHIKKAGLNSANDNQKAMMDYYAKSFGTGSLKAFKESQKLWVKDLGDSLLLPTTRRGLLIECRSYR